MGLNGEIPLPCLITTGSSKHEDLHYIDAKEHLQHGNLDVTPLAFLDLEPTISIACVFRIFYITYVQNVVSLYYQATSPLEISYPEADAETPKTH